jgi:hypothetical protein
MTRINYHSWQLILLTLAIGGIPGHAWAQSSVKVCYTTSPGVPQTCVIPNSDGSINTTSLTGGGYPPNATPISASATGTTGAVVATLAAVAGKTTYICGWSYQGSDATAGQSGTVVISGTITGSLNFAYPTLAAGATTPQPGPLGNLFTPCVPASAANTTIVVTSPALGAGATVAAVSAWGFQQ